jgi:hypothetical protein
VRLDGFLADDEPCGDVGVRVAGGDQFEDFEFAFRELVQAGPGRRSGCRSAQELGEQAMVISGASSASPATSAKRPPVSDNDVNP